MLHIDLFQNFQTPLFFPLHMYLYILIYTYIYTFQITFPINIIFSVKFLHHMETLISQYCYVMSERSAFWRN